MLYYYKIKKKRSLEPRKLLGTFLIVALACIYYLSASVPELNRQISSSLFDIGYLITKTPLKPTTIEAEAVDKGISIDNARAYALELRDEGKKREAKELEYSIDLLARTNKGDSLSEQRLMAVERDIEKTISYYEAGNTTSKRMQILGKYGGGNLAYVYYPNYGVHFNPVTTANMAIEQYEKGNYSEVVEITDDLLRNAVTNHYPGVGKFYIWEYSFDLEFRNHKIPAPWASGMAQGLILDIIGKSYKITGDRKYLADGKMVLNSFKVPWNKGGVTDSDEHGDWYLEIAGTDKLRILNGFLFTLRAIHNYQKQTGSNEALEIFNSGINEVKSHLGEYDLGYWSNYSLLKGNLANFEYHDVHIDLLNQLFTVTKVSELKTYADRFEFYQKNRFIDIPPTHQSFEEISLLTERGIIKSRNGLFEEKKEINRAELIIWLSRLAGWKPATIYNGYYPDVRRDCEAWGYIETAYEKGIILADGTGLFKPEDGLTQSEVTSILNKAAILPTGKTLASNVLQTHNKVTKEEAANILYECFKVIN